MKKLWLLPFLWSPSLILWNAFKFCHKIMKSILWNDAIGSGLFLHYRLVTLMRCIWNIWFPTYFFSYYYFYICITVWNWAHANTELICFINAKHWFWIISVTCQCKRFIYSLLNYFDLTWFVLQFTYVCEQFLCYHHWHA